MHPLAQVIRRFDSARVRGVARVTPRLYELPRPRARPGQSLFYPPRRFQSVLEVRFDSMLREFGPSSNETVQAKSLEELLDMLERRHPRLRFKLRDESGRLRRYVRVFVDGKDVSESTGVATSLTGARTIDILHSIAGG
jgi:sulfur-carrier protein